MRLSDRLGELDSVERFEPFWFKIKDLDDVVRGVRPGFLNYVAARPHAGKTRLVTEGLLRNPDLPALFISADDSPDLIVRKMMMSLGVVKDGWDATPSQMSGFLEANFPHLDIVDDVTWGPRGEAPNAISLGDAIERYATTMGELPRVVVYDYVGVEGGQDFSSADAVAGWGRAVSKRLPMPVIVIAQFNRAAAATKRETGHDGVQRRRGVKMEDLAFGGEQQAGLIIGVSRERHIVGHAGVQDVMAVDVVKNKAVFGPHGLTDQTSPIILPTLNNRIVGYADAVAHWDAASRYREDQAYGYDD